MVIGHIQSRYSDGPPTPVIRVASRTHLLALLAKHKSLRASFEDEFLAAWDSYAATHRNYEEGIGGRGWRIQIVGKPDKVFEIGYNIEDCLAEELQNSHLFKRIFDEEELNRMEFIANDI